MATTKKEQTVAPATAAAAAAAAASDVRRMLGEIRAHERALRDKHAALTRERQTVESANRSREEVLAESDRIVDDLAAKWTDDHGGRLVSCVSGELRSLPSGTTGLRRARPELPSLRPGDALSLEDLAGLFPDLLKARLRAIIEAQPAKVFGLAAAAREQRVAELAAELAAVERDHELLVSTAVEAGLTLRHLDRTESRLRAEQEAAAREAALQRERDVIAGKLAAEEAEREAYRASLPLKAVRVY